jgi:hypothetical protein
MNPADPFFTWTCLFPEDASYRFAPHTTWAREGGADFGSTPNGNSVYVTANARVTDLPHLDTFAGLVTLNCSGVSDRRLCDAGFSYVRRFALLPSAENPRWFIPLDTPALSAAGFCLCATFRAAAQIQNQGARAAARLGLPLWYRDHLCIAQRSMPPVEQAMEDVLSAGHPIRLAISSGTPPPAINRKITIAALAPGGRVIAFAKIPGPGAASERSVRREAAVLSQLSRRPAGTRAPQVLFAGRVGPRLLAVMTPLRGHTPGLEMRPAHERFLAGLASEAATAAAAADTAFVRTLAERRSLLDMRPDLMSVLLELLALLKTLRFPATIVHGDFVPWNLREHLGAIGAFDWEYGEIEGIPLIDETHHLLAVGYLLRKWTPEQAHHRLAEVAAVAPHGLAPATVRALHLAYLLDYLLRLFAEGHGDDYPRVAWCREIVARLAPTATAAVKGAAA